MNNMYNMNGAPQPNQGVAPVNKTVAELNAEKVQLLDQAQQIRLDIVAAERNNDGSPQAEGKLKGLLGLGAALEAELVKINAVLLEQDNKYAVKDTGNPWNDTLGATNGSPSRDHGQNGDRRFPGEGR